MSTEGIWGLSDSQINFCESDYELSHLVAEFWNSSSSLIYCVLGLVGAAQAMHARCCRLYVLMFLTLAVTGAGSAIFHGTMRWWGELLDEIPMVFLAYLFLLGLQGIHPLTSNARGKMFYTTVTLTITVGIAAYVKYKFYEIFLHMFTLAIILSLGIVHTSRPRCMQTNQFFRLVIAELLVGKTVWSIEHHLCGMSKVVPYLHVVWHISSAFAAYHFILTLMALRFEKIGYSAVWTDSKPMAHKSIEFGRFRFQPFSRFNVSQDEKACSFGVFHKQYRKIQIIQQQGKCSN